jgi:hypothetical protein
MVSKEKQKMATLPPQIKPTLKNTNYALSSIWGLAPHWMKKKILTWLMWINFEWAEHLKTRILLIPK